MPAPEYVAVISGVPIRPGVKPTEQLPAPLNVQLADPPNVPCCVSMVCGGLILQAGVTFGTATTRPPRSRPGITAAATALAHEIPLVTRYPEPYQNIEGLELLRPY